MNTFLWGVQTSDTDVTTFLDMDSAATYFLDNRHTFPKEYQEITDTFVLEKIEEVV